MAKVAQINHLIDHLQKQGFYPKNLSNCPGCIDENVKDAINKLLNSPKGKSVRVVVNAFRCISTEFAFHVEKTDYVTQNVRIGVGDFIERNCSRKQEAA